MRLKVIKWTAISLFIIVFTGLATIGVISYRNTIIPAGIVIHHSATMPYRILRPEDVQAISNNHEKKGFSTFYWGNYYHIGYHYIILPNGEIIQGRPEKCRGSHAIGYNSYIGICLIGNFTEKDSYLRGLGLNQPTPEQIQSLISITEDLSKRYHIPTENIVTHNNINPKTECPGEKFPINDFFKEIKKY
jgi:N-acetyl-anhydromuramyl-L-alanine amidase AmpD